MPATWSEAIAEAYTLVPDGGMIFHTLELSHVGIRDLAGNPTAVRMVLDDGELLEEGDPDVYGRVFKLEADAAMDAGQFVSFVSCAFEFSLPDQKDREIPSVSITLDNVAHLVSAYMDDAVQYRDKLSLTYREYLSPNGEPQFILPGLTVQRVDIAGQRVTLTASFDDLVNRNFPGKLYRVEEFGALAA